ncbi:unnamed protein product, partial [Prorocentrum cordatum]
VRLYTPKAKQTTNKKSDNQKSEAADEISTLRQLVITTTDAQLKQQLQQRSLTLGTAVDP